MAAEVGDCATVLEQFIHDSANLPNEINYMMEEVQAVDKDMLKHQQAIKSKEIAFEKQVKNHGSLVAHPREFEFVEFGRKQYEIALAMQDKKISYADKAYHLFNRQLKRLDERIHQLQRTGQMEEDPTLPSVFNRKPDTQKSFVDLPTGPIPLQASSISALNASAHRLNSYTTPTIRQPQPRQLSQVASSTTPTQRSSPALPASAAAQVHPRAQSERDSSVGADTKRRKLTMATTGINLPSQPSGLRQSSIGPGTPKAGTPTGSRAGSIPGTSIAPANKKAGPVGTTKKLPHQQVTKLKNKAHKQPHLRLSQSGRPKKGVSPSTTTRGQRGGTEASEDSVLSSADASDTDNSTARKRRTKKAAQARAPVREEDVGDEDEEEEGEDEGDDRTYCYCSQPSYGEMVGCENNKCKREWFHISCLGLKSVPTEEHWYCPECRVELGEGAGGGNKKRK